MLRGLAALVRWAEASAGAVPLSAIEGVVEHLIAAYPDGVVRPRRRAHAGKGTLAPARRRVGARAGVDLPAARGASSVIGEPSEALTRQWSATRRALLGLIDDGRLAS